MKSHSSLLTTDWDKSGDFQWLMTDISVCSIDDCMDLEYLNNTERMLYGKFV